MAIAIFLAFFLFIGQGAVGQLVCEELPVGMCSYSIDSSRYRCVLETFELADETTILQCKKSQVLVTIMKEHIESDHCIRACGLDRFSVGISTDSLADHESVKSLCSFDCYQNCPNIIDLFVNLALAEGSPLNARCKNHQLRSRASAARRRAMQLLKASGPSVVASDPPFAAAESLPSAADCPTSADAPEGF
ncbi:hypothetical protein LIER_15925 [Lithospermum erythrorhizon]|uniref:PAR1 protein n=1 Tax=Lithospermum erythrorhizon TaxID=34254 RepID=A0AAV3Q7A7_LITER